MRHAQDLMHMTLSGIPLSLRKACNLQESDRRAISTRVAHELRCQPVDLHTTSARGQPEGRRAQAKIGEVASKIGEVGGRSR